MASKSHAPPHEGGHGLVLLILGKPKKKSVASEGERSPRRLDRGGRARAPNRGVHPAMHAGHLTTEARARMPKSEFALPGKISKGPRGGRHTHGAYPIPDEAHARAALSRAKQFASPSEQKTIRAAVHRKFPGMELSED